MSADWEDEAENILEEAHRAARRMSQHDAQQFYEHIGFACEVSSRAIDEDIEREDLEYEDSRLLGAEDGDED